MNFKFERWHLLLAIVVMSLFILCGTAEAQQYTCEGGQCYKQSQAAQSQMYAPRVYYAPQPMYVRTPWYPGKAAARAWRAAFTPNYHFGYFTPYHY